MAAKRHELSEFVDSQYKLLSEAALRRTSDYLVRAATTPPDPLETAIFFLSLAPEDLRPQIVARWRRYLEQRVERSDPVFGPWKELMALPDLEYRAKSGAIISRWQAHRRGTQSGQLNPLIAELLAHSRFRDKADVARAYGELIRKIDEEGRAFKAASSPGAEHEARRQIQAILGDHDSPAYFPKSQIFSYLSWTEKDGFGGKLTELDRMVVKAAGAPPRAMVLLEAEELCAPRIFVRGNPSQPGQVVPRQFLRVIAGPDRYPFPHGSGRLDLAHAITAPANPLTSRVIVNRLWMHHFGEPMVSTPSDFGARSTPPSHPLLLDYLAARLMRESWSLKAVHRLILLSSTYQQASFDRPDCRPIDPENRLLWRSIRRRLDLEAIRDTLLLVSGRLDRQMGGRPVDVGGDSKNRRRTVYGMVDRQSLPAVFRAFDFASPDQSAERRPRTTVPQQALFSMNAPFVIEQAKALAARPDVAAAQSAERRVAALYRAVLARSPIAAELQAASRFLQLPGPAPGTPGSSLLSRIEELAQVLMMTNEFMFVD